MDNGTDSPSKVVPPPGTDTATQPGVVDTTTAQTDPNGNQQVSVQNNDNTGGNNQQSTDQGGQTSDGSDPFADKSDMVAQQVRSILQLNCAQCHEGSNQGGLSYVLEYQRLVTSQQIIPGSSADSPIFVRMTQQQMPPAEVTKQRPSLGDIDIVGQWIDSLQKTDAGRCTPLPFVSSDDQITAMENDVRNLPNAADKQFTRYLTLTYVSNAGDCGLTLKRQRYALFKAINSVSTNPVIGNPVPIDQNETIYRIDIRDYNWDRPIDLKDVGVVDFNDGWLSLVAAAQPFAVEYQGDQADALKADTQTAVPFMPVNAFVQASQFGDEYYTLIGGKALFQDFTKDVLGVDQQAEIAAEQVVRAGFSGSGVSHQERGVIRFDSQTGGGYSLWTSLDFDGGGGVAGKANDSIFSNPLEFNNAAGEAIFNLPNGMQGYYVSLQDGTRLAQAAQGVVLDPSQNNGIVTNGASCHSCHNAGMISFGDQVRQFVIDNKFNFDTDTYQQVMDTFPDQTTMQKYIDADSQIHVNATIKAGLPEGTPDPVSRVYIDFQLANITTAQVAGELNVTKDVLVQNLHLLDPTLQDLSDPNKGFVERPVLQNVFLETVCALHSVDVNTPVGCP
ncbi:MAG TPA: hypothetical protein VG963_30350 [Polyangiaceae bacterium]|nr:hypothetical protein [Polyangiaceae bacterium]